jgi:hypothetical protein
LARTPFIAIRQPATVKSPSADQNSGADAAAARNRPKTANVPITSRPLRGRPPMAAIPIAPAAAPRPTADTIAPYPSASSPSTSRAKTGIIGRNE